MNLITNPVTGNNIFHKALYSTLPHACYVSTVLCIYTDTAAQATGTTFNTMSKQYLILVRGTVHHYHIEVPHTDSTDTTLGLEHN